MFSINTNTSAMAALASLTATAQQLSMTQNEISTGQKVSQASDNPAIYSISQTMNGDIAGLSAVSDNLSFAQSVIGVASSGAAQISSQLSTLKQTITQAQSQGLSAATMQNQVDALLQNIDAFAQSATFNGVNMLAHTGSTSLSVTQDIAGDTLAVGSQDMSTAGLGLSGLSVNQGGAELSFDSTFVPANGDSFMFADNNFNTFGSVSSYASGTGFTAQAGYTTTPTGAPTGNPPASVAQAWVFEFDDGSTAPTAVPQTIYDSTTNQVVAKVNVVSISLNSNASPMSDIGSLITAMQHAGLGVQQNTDGTVDVTGVDTTNPNWTNAVSVASGGATATAVNGTTVAINTVDNAIANANTKAAALGAASQQITGMQNFSAALSDSLTNGLGALTDADMAAESAKLQSLQTKQQLAIQSLSIANQQPQSLLSLFR
ncbi:MAG TPA: flagellin [Acetobacteraceae bacterium]|nr:flagellin [Acetobacteraceae bacterium]